MSVWSHHSDHVIWPVIINLGFSILIIFIPVLYQKQPATTGCSLWIRCDLVVNPYLKVDWLNACHHCIECNHTWCWQNKSIFNLHWMHWMPLVWNCLKVMYTILVCMSRSCSFKPKIYQCYVYHHRSLYTVYGLVFLEMLTRNLMLISVPIFCISTCICQVCALLWE